MYSLVDGTYPRWPIFIERTVILNRICKNLLGKSNETVRSEARVFFQQLKNRSQFLYAVVKYGSKGESTVITEAVTILNNSMVQI